MKDFFKWGLIFGGAGYFLFSDQLAAMFGGSAAAAAPQPAGPSQTTAAATTAQLIQQYTRNANLPGRMTFDQWDWVYAKVRGNGGPPIEAIFPGQDRARQMTFDEYWAGITSAGLSGIRRRRSTAAMAWGY